jgi:hypothetical protein
MEEETQELKEQANNRPWLYKKGQSGNPKGRPVGTFSMKEWARKKLASMTDEEREEFMEGLPKIDIWKMSEGMPDTKGEVKVEGNITFEISEKIANKNDTNS